MNSEQCNGSGVNSQAVDGERIEKKKKKKRLGLKQCHE